MFKKNNFSAGDAKTLALNAQIKQKEDEFKRIIKAIQFEASEGETQYRGFDLYPETINKLKELGYKVSPAIGNSFIISWGGIGSVKYNSNVAEINWAEEEK